MRAACLALVLALPACAATPRTQVMLELDGDEALVREADRLEVHITGGVQGTPVESYTTRLRAEFEPGLPRQIALVPADEESRRGFRVEARLVDSEDAIIGTVRAVSSYASERTVLLRLSFASSCREFDCEQDETCRDEECVSAIVDPVGLPDLPEEG